MCTKAKGTGNLRNGSTYSSYADVAAKLVGDLDTELTHIPELRTAGALNEVAVGSIEHLPPCGRLAQQLLTRFLLLGDFTNSQTESRLVQRLGALDQSYCDSIDALIPHSPENGMDLSLLEPRLQALRDAAQVSLDGKLADSGIDRRIDLPKDWNIPNAATYAEWIRQQLIMPLKAAMNDIIGEQLNASQSMRPLLPDPAAVSGKEEFENNPVVSNLFKGQIQNLTDGAFGCLGLANLRGHVQVNDDLGQLMSDTGTIAFNQRLGHLLFENVLRTRLTGTVDDFSLKDDRHRLQDGRCGPAGVSAYHRGYLPGFALLISLMGLIYHCSKVVLYGLRFARMPSLIRQAVTTVFVLFLLGLPLSKSAAALQVRETDLLIQRYTQTHGAVFEFGVRCLIKAQALYHPATDALYRTGFEPLGITFTREIEPEELEQQNAFVDQSCGIVPQIREAPQYQVLRTIITHRDLCREDAPAQERIAGR